jgi:hypothetical protein
MDASGIAHITFGLHLACTRSRHLLLSEGDGLASRRWLTLPSQHVRPAYYRSCYLPHIRSVWPAMQISYVSLSALRGPAEPWRWAYYVKGE